MQPSVTSHHGGPAHCHVGVQVGEVVLECPSVTNLHISMRLVLLLSTLLSFTVLAKESEELVPLGHGKQVWNEGYALQKPNGGMEAREVEQGTYWVERRDGKCDLKHVRVADPEEFKNNKFRTSPPVMVTKEEVGECRVQKFLLPSANLK